MTEVILPIEEVGAVVLTLADSGIGFKRDSGIIDNILTWDPAQGDLTIAAPVGTVVGGGSRRVLIPGDVVIGGLLTAAIAWTELSGTPVTLAGYGIADAYTKANSDARYALTTDSYTKIAADARFLPIAGTAVAATILATVRNINGIAFNGSANITIPYSTGAVPWAALTGAPTTLAGYGITDSYTKVTSDALYQTIALALTQTSGDARYLKLAGGTLTGALTVNAPLTVVGTTSWIYAIVQNIGGNTLLGVEGSVGNVLTPGSTAYASLIGTNTANPMQFFTNNVIRMTIAATGAVTLASTLAVIGNVGIGGAPLTSALSFLRNQVIGWYNVTTLDQAIYADGASQLVFYTANTPRLAVKANGVINLASIPTVTTGLVTGDLWRNGNVINII
jgi:hypothetical protein